MDMLYKEMISKQSMAAEAQTQRCQGYIKPDVLPLQQVNG